MRDGLNYHTAVRQFRMAYIEAALVRARGNRTHAARQLGIQRSYLLRLIRELAVAVPPSPRGGREGGEP